MQSLVDKKRLPVNAMHNVSVLNEIAIYTYEEEVPLRNIFKTITEKENEVYQSAKKVTDKLISFFLKYFPDYDEDRVYPSNIKKVVQWYNLLAKS